LHESFGTNWRMLEMQAVIGRIQLRRMSDWTARRLANTQRLSKALTRFSGTDGVIHLPKFGCASCPSQCAAAGCIHAQYKFYSYVRPESLAAGWTRDRIVETMNAAGVPCYQGSCSEVYLEKAFDNTGWRPIERLPVAKELGETSLMFLVHPTLTSAEIDKACEVITKVLSEAAITK
jgi:dTDP-4-amino-4,6-dideoxygalactose transaminase